MEEPLDGTLTSFRYRCAKNNGPAELLAGYVALFAAFPGRVPVKPPKNSPEQSENPDCVAAGQRQPAQQEIEIMPISFAHRGGRVVGGEQCLFNGTGQEFQIARGSWNCLVGLIGDRCRLVTSSFLAYWSSVSGRRCCLVDSRRDFIKTDGDGLAEIHRGLPGIGGDLSEQMTKREIFAREAALLRAEDEGDPTAAGKLFS
jgi:hypothetical protein